MKSLAGLRDHLESSNVRAFLMAIRFCEGTYDHDGYRKLFGGSLFESYRDHPRTVKTFKLRKGGVLSSSAAGAYQILTKTWNDLIKTYPFPDFSPRTQDMAAVALIARRGALKLVINGQIEKAILKCNKEWASFPGSPYGQPTKTMAQVLKVYQDNGGTLS